MKKELFEKYVKAISRVFDIDEELIFTKNKKRNMAESRQMLYYMCSNRPMRISFIQEQMIEHGYQVSHSTIIQSIKVMENKIQADRDYHHIIKKIQESL